MFDPDITIAIAFLAGVLSFLSPCILPVLPSFLGYISGISITPASLKLPNSKLRSRLAFNGVLFSLGFLSVFLVVGASIGFVGKVFILNQRLFQIIGGVIVLFLGLYLLDLFDHMFLKREYKFKPPKWFDRLGPLRSFGVGIIFSFGWAPCYGPITGAILTLVAVQGSALQGLWLFGWYSFGFILPFLVISFFVGHATSWIRRSRRAIRYFNLAAGALVLILGLLLLTDHFSLLVNWLTSRYSEWDIWQFN